MPVSATDTPRPMVVHGIAGLVGLAGTRLGPSPPVRIEQERIDVFADATEDRQWIHVNAQRAAAGPFGRTIAHGYLTLSLCSHFLAALLEVRDVSMAVNYGADRIRFPSPVPAGSELIAQGEVLSVEDVGGGAQSKVRLTLSVAGSAKPACVADVLVRHYA